MKKTTTTKTHPTGATSLLVVTAIALVFIAITIGLTALSVREARQALDTDLSNRALAAAESSARDAAQWIADNPTAQYPNCDSNNLSGVQNVPPGELSGLIKPAISSTSDNATEIVCRTVTVNTTQVTQQIKKDDSSQIYTFQPTNNGVNLFRLQWGKTGQNPLPASYQPYALPDASSVGAVEVTAVYWPKTGTNTYTTDPSTALGSKTVLIMPTDPPKDFAPTPISISSTCNNPGSVYVCRADIDLTQLVPDPLNSNIVIQLKSRYKDADIRAEFFNGLFSNSPIEVQQSRAVIDVTAKVGNLYRRIQAEKPIGNNSFIVDVINSNASICKNMTVEANFALKTLNSCS